MEYELFYLIGASKEAEAEQIKSEVKDIVSAEEVKFIEKQVEEKRKLAYPVKHETHGLYIAQRFELEDPEKTQSITQKLNLYTKIMRFMITRADELPPLLSRAERKEESLAQAERQRAREPQLIIENAGEAKPETKKELQEKVSEEDLNRELEEILNL